MKKLICIIAVLAMLLCLCACTKDENNTNTTIPSTEEVITCQHNYEKTVGSEATCTEDGVLNLKCIYCKAEATEAIPASGHDFSAATCTAPATCYNCGTTEGSVTSHDYYEGACIDCGAATGQKKSLTEGIWSYTDSSEGTKQYTLNLKAKTLTVANGDSTGDSASVTYTIDADTATVSGEGFTLALERVSDTSFKVSATTGESAVLPPVDAFLAYASK